MLLIYLDTCVYCRPFDDQAQTKILDETKAFIKILEVAETKKITIVSSDFLFDEIDEIADTYKSLEVKGFMKVCERHVKRSAEIIKLAKEIRDKCHLTGADALHIACASETKYFITCDGFILSRRKCINKVMQEEGYGVEVISVVDFVEEKKWE